MSCCAVGCTNRFNKNNKTRKFYRIPSSRTPFKANRRRLWLEALGRSDWNEQMIKNARVCNDHFISGAASEDFDSPDFAPSIFSCSSQSGKQGDAKVEEKTPSNETPARKPDNGHHSTAIPSVNDCGLESAQTTLISPADDCAIDSTAGFYVAKTSSMGESFRSCHCSVPCCTNNKKYFPYLGFHSFPADKELRSRWVEAIRRDEGPDFKIQQGSTFVCSLHFAPEERFVSSYGWKKIKKGAVPSRFAWNNWGKGGLIEIQQPRFRGSRRKRLRGADNLLPGPEDESNALLIDHNYAHYPPPDTVEDCPSEEQLSTADSGASTNGVERVQVRRETDLEDEQQSDQDGRGNSPKIRGCQTKKMMRNSEINSRSSWGKKFLELLHHADDGVLDIRKVSLELKVPRRRLYDAANVLQGINVIRKKSLNLIEWSYRPAIAESHEGVADLVTEERKLDELIQACTWQIRQLCMDEKHAYVTYEDINKLNFLEDQTVMLIQAAPKTELEVSHSLKSLYIHSTMEPINVFLCREHPANWETTDGLHSQSSGSLFMSTSGVIDSLPPRPLSSSLQDSEKRPASPSPPLTDNQAISPDESNISRGTSPTLTTGYCDTFSSQQSPPDKTLSLATLTSTSDSLNR